MVVCCPFEGFNEVVFDIVTEEKRKWRLQLNVCLDVFSTIEFDYLVVVKHSLLL